MPTLLVLLAILLAVGFVGLLVLLARRGGPAEDDGATFTLRHSPALRIFSIVALFGFWAGIVPPQDERLAVAFTLGAAALAASGFALLWESYRWKLTVSPAGLDCRSPWKAPRTVPWSAVQSVTWSPLNGWHVVRFGGGSFRIPGIVPGAGRFLAAWAAR
jgi:hypothetical protein